jgi:glutamate synthase (NADPH) small chain
MGKITGFLEFKRKKPTRLPVPERLTHWNEFEHDLSESELREQGARCMDCGIPFCHTGCPLGNAIPDWNDTVYRDRWEQAASRLHATNNFPEMTGRICPAPCEEACVLNINQEPVTIKQIEKQIADRALHEDGWYAPRPAPKRTGKKIAVIGSGPAGLACAQQLARAGHSPVVFERDDRIGGLLRYGIPNFKMEKHLIDSRMRQMEGEGVTFRAGVNVGTDYAVEKLRKEFDAVVLSAGATMARDLPLEGRKLKGVHFAMEFLTQQNRINEGDTLASQISAKGKKVIILGGGDTGSDCLGTSNRQGAESVHQFELMPRPPDDRTVEMPWPYWPMIMRTSTSQEEGVERDFSINTKQFVGDGKGQVKQLMCARLTWTMDNDGRRRMEELPGSQFALDADLVLLALGFVGPEKPLPQQFGLEMTPHGTVKVDDNYMASVPGVFSCGDMRRGQSLVVWAIWEGREAARGVDAYLMGRTDLVTSPMTAPLVLGG